MCLENSKEREHPPYTWKKTISVNWEENIPLNWNWEKNIPLYSESRVYHYNRKGTSLYSQWARLGELLYTGRGASYYNGKETLNWEGKILLNCERNIPFYSERKAYHYNGKRTSFYT
jgi:hypothetical protein